MKPVKGKHWAKFSAIEKVYLIDDKERKSEICPLCGGVMEKKYNEKGNKALFWGCIKYPKCKGMEIID